MSNIFNLLGGISESDRDHVIKPIVRSKTSHEIRSNSAKGMGGTKPKGLSMRSNSDMNVSCSTQSINIKRDINKEQKLLSLKVTQNDNNGRPISPGKEILVKKSTAQMTKFKQVPKEEIVFNKTLKTQQTLYDDNFKRPLLPKKFVKRFPEPENLAHYYENQDDIDYNHIETIEKELKHLLSKENIMPHEEERFISDSKTLVSPEIPRLILPIAFDRECIELSSPELPEISDDDNL